jgi:hypothetical protein
MEDSSTPLGWIGKEGDVFVSKVYYGFALLTRSYRPMAPLGPKRREEKTKTGPGKAPPQEGKSVA